MAQPDLIITPFAEDAAPGYVDTIPESLPPGSDPQYASWSQGFPPVTMTPLGAGGIPPRGQSFNGVLNAISNHLVFIEGGGQYKWDSEYALENGYGLGAIIQKASSFGFWLCTVDGNTSNPDSGGAGWVDYAQSLIPYAVDSGSINAFAANYVPAQLTVFDGQVLRFKSSTSNTGASTFSPNGLAAKPILGGAHSPLQGGEIVSSGEVWLQYNSSLGGGSWVVIASEGGSLQISAATKSQQAVQLGQVSGIVGQSRNLRMAIASASASATMTADEIIVETALGGLRYCLASFNKTVNLATTGAGGMDTGTAPVSGYVSVYAIYNPTTGVSALLACAQATSNGSIYSGANMPAGYTASALVSSNATNASSQFKTSTTIDRTVIIPSVTGYTSSGGTIPSPVPISLVSVVPLNAKLFSGILNASSTVATSLGISVGADAANSGYQNVNCSSVQQITAPFRCPIITAQTTYLAATAGGGTPTYGISVSSYEF